jgi:Terminase RNaseH-like domain
VKELASRYRADVILIEDKASGIQLIQELRYEGVAVRAAPVQDASKRTRLENQTPKFESRFVHLPKQAPWLDIYVLELTTFPNARFDDQVDSTTHALAWDTEQMNIPGIGLLHYYQQEAAKAERGSSESSGDVERVRCIKNRPSTVYLMSGHAKTVPEDGILEVPPDDAAALKRTGNWERCD